MKAVKSAITALECSARRRADAEKRTIVFDLETIVLLRRHAEPRRLSANALARRIVDCVLDDGLVDAVLDDGGGA